MIRAPAVVIEQIVNDLTDVFDNPEKYHTVTTFIRDLERWGYVYSTIELLQQALMSRASMSRGLNTDWYSTVQDEYQNPIVTPDPVQTPLGQFTTAANELRAVTNNPGDYPTLSLFITDDERDTLAQASAILDHALQRRSEELVLSEDNTDWAFYLREEDRINNERHV